MVVLKRTLDNGINGYHSPDIPRAPRSIRRRGLRQKAREGGQICAFELLATVAGKLLEETECSSASSSAAVGFDQCGVHKDAIKKEPPDIGKPYGGDHDDQGSSEGSVFCSGLQRDNFKGKLETVDEAIGDHLSLVASSGCSEKVHSDHKSMIQKGNQEFVKLSSVIEGESPKCGESVDADHVDRKMNRHIDTNRGASGDFTLAKNKSPALTNSEEIVELPLFRDSNPNASFLKPGDDVKLGCKDDDEILSGYSQPNEAEKECRSPTHPGDRKVRKFLSSKYWKQAQKLREYEVPDSGAAVKQSNHDKRPFYDLDRSQRNTPIKKRKLLDRSSVVTQEGGISCESVSNSPVKSIDNEKNGLGGKRHEGNGTPSSPFGSQKSCNLRNSNVRLSIKSFKVPELFIEVPESTTVGSLKRTVVEAVTAILCGGLRVGVLLHGKKIRDDNRTLLQTSISQNDGMNAIEFMLEPNNPSQSPPMCHEDPSPAPLQRDSPKFVNRCQANPNNHMFHLEKPDKPSITDSNSPAGSCVDLLSSPKMELKDKNLPDSKALVPVVDASMEALAVMPVSQRPKRSEIGQRRTRRPFSVSEVEALVQAVEKLGTGRWRDVKLCAFENAKHRTYVDLKDKWKTLVHTARISPQQRRGEPVPQELLDRVLVAQAYWSGHQAKQHGKQQQQQQAIIPKLADSTIDKP